MPASLRLLLTDAYGHDLNDHVVVHLYSMSGFQTYQVEQRIARELVIDGIDVDASNSYRVEIVPANHATVQYIISLKDGAVKKFTAPVPADPRRVVAIVPPIFTKLPDAAKNILRLAQAPRFNNGTGGFLANEELYNAIGTFPLLQACFLNIVAKSSASALNTGEPCSDHFKGLLRIEQDRFFVQTTAELVETTAHSNGFHKVSAALHDPMPGYHIVSSFKTWDRYGNLQLTFQRRGDTGNDYAADVDIDDAQGFEHIFQVATNMFNGPTNPYNIHEILLQQKPVVDPGYSLKFAEAP